jgi:hypothetical protein
MMIGYSLFVAGSCGEPEISGCTNSSACNYNIEATIDNDSCIFSEENLDCNGNCMFLTDDGCECAVLYDECGFCGGDDSSCTDCNGDFNGSAFIDGCENCVGGNTELEFCPSDCLGIDGGDAWINSCAECVPSGDLTCVQGCDGNWVNDGTQMIVDDCGICGGDNNPNTGNCDCNGIVYPNDNFWKIQLIVSNIPLVPEGNEPIDTVYDEENYIGGSQYASDNYDEVFDIIEPPHQGNYVSFYFPHEEWNAWSGDNFTQDIRSNNISDYHNVGKIWEGEIFSNITGLATLTVSSFSNISGADILISIDGSEFIQLNLNETTEEKLLMSNQSQIVNIQISNLCY